MQFVVLGNDIGGSATHPEISERDRKGNNKTHRINLTLYYRQVKVIHNVFDASSDIMMATSRNYQTYVVNRYVYIIIHNQCNTPKRQVDKYTSYIS